MKREYDFSKAEKGKFFKPGGRVNLPVYLDAGNFSFIRRIVEKKHSDYSTVVNDLIDADRRIARAAG